MTTTEKVLAQADFETIKKMHNDGKNYTEIARHFTDEGYRTDKGRLLTQSDISRFMLQSGHRIAKRGSGTKKVYEQSKLEEIGQVLSTALSDKLKVSSIQAIVKG